MPSMTTLFECVLCSYPYSELDIFNHLFFIETRICYKCYRKMQKADYSISCFGKYTDGKNLGYTSLSEDCRSLCPDRRLCPLFANREIIKLRKTAEKETEVLREDENPSKLYPFKTKTLIDRAFKLCMEGVSKDRLKKWCKKKNTSYYRLLTVLRHGKKYGKQWRWNEDRLSVKLEYPI